MTRVASGFQAIVCAICGCALGFLSFGGCTHRQVVFPSQLPSPDDVIRKIRYADTAKTLRAWGTSHWRYGQQKGSAHVAIILHRPDRFRVEGLSPFGSSLYSLVIEGEEISLYVPSEARVYRGAASRGIMERFFALPLKAEEALDVLSGRVPLCEGRARRIYQEGDHLALDVACDTESWLQKVLLNSRGLEPIGFRLEDLSAEDILVVDWADFTHDGEVRVPTEISLEMPKRRHWLRLRMEEIEINPSIPDEQFQLILPPETEVYPLSS